jgi:hypothetical protein
MRDRLSYADDPVGISRCHRPGSGMFLMPPRAEQFGKAFG